MKKCIYLLFFSIFIHCFGEVREVWLDGHVDLPMYSKWKLQPWIANLKDSGKSYHPKEVIIIGLYSLDDEYCKNDPSIVIKNRGIAYIDVKDYFSENHYLNKKVETDNSCFFTTIYQRIR